MQIPMSKKIEDYKESVVMGLPLKESFYLIIGVVVAVCITCLCHFILGIDIMISAYVATPFVLIIVAGGFKAKNGMTYKEMYKTKKNLRKYGGKALVAGSPLNEKYITGIVQEMLEKRGRDIDDDFDATLKKMKVLAVIVSVAVIVVIIAIVIILKFK